MRGDKWQLPMVVVALRYVTQEACSLHGMALIEGKYVTQDADYG